MCDCNLKTQDEKENFMKKKLSNVVLKYGSIFCAIAVAVTNFGVLSCRGQFYQPREPKNLKMLFKGDDKNV